MIESIESSGNVFQDLGFTGLELLELTAKSALMNLVHAWMDSVHISREQFFNAVLMSPEDMTEEERNSFLNCEIDKLSLYALCRMITTLVSKGHIKDINFPKDLEN